MKYLDEYRDGDVAQKIVGEMRRIQTRPWVLMEVCGGQTHSIVKNGIDHLLPEGRGAGAWARLPGLRNAAGNDRQSARDCAATERYFLLLRRHVARARIGWRPVHHQVAWAATCALSIHRSIASRSHEPIRTSRWCFLPSALRPQPRRTPCWRGARARSR